MDLIDQLKKINILMLSRLMKIPATTIYAWRDKGKIPSWRINTLEKALKKVKPKGD